MKHRNPAWLQTELSKIISQLLEQDVHLSAEEALHIASQMRQSKDRTLIESMFAVN